MAVSRADEVKALEREWWRRAPQVLWRPREVFATLREDSDDLAAALSEPMVAITFLSGIAMFLSTATAGRLYDDPDFDWMLLLVEAIVAGALVALQNYWLGGAALLIGLRCVGSMRRYREARHVIGLAAMPFVLALLAVWPVRLLVFGTDLFRTGGSDEGSAGVVLRVVDAGFVAWALALVIVGVRTIEEWSWMRSAIAAAFAALLFGLLITAAVLA